MVAALGLALKVVVGCWLGIKDYHRSGVHPGRGCCVAQPRYLRHCIPIFFGAGASFRSKLPRPSLAAVQLLIRMLPGATRCHVMALLGRSQDVDLV